MCTKGFLVPLIILICFGIVSSVPAQENHAELHWWYKGLKDTKGTSCCNGKDCGVTNFRIYSGKLQVVIHDRWCDVDTARILTDKVAPDRGTHVCAPETPFKGLECLHYCVIIGTGS